MNLQDFFNFNNNCPVCNNVLTKEAQVDILVDIQNIGADKFSFAGSIQYKYFNYKFIKSNILNSNIESIMHTIYNNIGKTFSINKKFDPKFGYNKLSNIIKPWFIHSYETRAARMCYGNGHLYYYETQCIYPKDDCNDLNIDHEILDIHSYRIYNMFRNNIGYKTGFGDKLKYNESELHNNMIKLPFMPITKWDAKTSDSIKSQAEKYIILK